MQDPYNILGIDRNASQGDIKKAFRNLAKKYHPDINKSDAAAKKKFAEVNAAYEFLSNKDRRSAYDKGEIDADGNPRFSGFGGARSRSEQPFGTGFKNQSPFTDDIINDLFSAFGARGRPGGTHFNQSGSDDNVFRRQQTSPSQDAVKIKVSLEEVHNGDKKKIQLPSGKMVNVQIPKGIGEGQQIRLRSQGSFDAAGHRKDVIATVQYASHKIFELLNGALYLDLPISLDEAILGAKVVVPTLSKSISVQIPAQSNSGTRLRLKGQGLATGENSAGDLILRLMIVLPKPGVELNNIAKLVKQLGGENPRKDLQA